MGMPREEEEEGRGRETKGGNAKGKGGGGKGKVDSRWGCQGRRRRKAGEGRLRVGMPREEEEGRERWNGEKKSEGKVKCKRDRS